jgi:hypothetical protein
LTDINKNNRVAICNADKKIKRRTKMKIKKLLLSLIALTFLIGLTSQAQALPTTLDFFGKIKYNANGVKFPTKFVPDLHTQTFNKAPLLRMILNSQAPYTMVAAVDYELGDLQPWDTSQPGFLHIDVWTKGFYKEYGRPKVEFNETLNTTITLPPAVMQGTADLFNYLTGLPGSFYNGTFGYLHTGTVLDGQIYAVAEVPFLDSLNIKKGKALFGGTLQLSQASNPVPEPASMLLFGIGLIGLAGLNRRVRKS